jgi:hypothetical protein
MTDGGLGPRLREIIGRAAPSADGSKLDAVARDLALYINLRFAARPAISRQGTVPALARLEKVDEQIMRLAEALDSLGPDERLALRGREGDMWAALETIKRGVETSHAVLSEAPSIPTRRSKPRNVTAEAIALRCARTYSALTGLRATVSTRTKDGTAYGPFLELVTGVFQAAGVDARPEGYARRAVEAAKEFSPPK